MAAQPFTELAAPLDPGLQLFQGWLDARVTGRDEGTDPLPGRGGDGGGDPGRGASG